LVSEIHKKVIEISLQQTQTLDEIYPVYYEIEGHDLLPEIKLTISDSNIDSSAEFAKFSQITWEK
jgi:hypothetical protein